MRVDILGLVVIVAIAALGVWRLSALASRIDRLHHRVELARATLDAQLLRRSQAAESLANSGLVDPVSSMVLARAASNCRAMQPSDPVGISVAESELSRDLREVFDDPSSVAELRSTPEGDELISALAAACAQVALSRRFLNDGVQAARLLRQGRLVRTFHLAGHARRPEMFEMDDVAPRTFAVLA